MSDESGVLHLTAWVNNYIHNCTQVTIIYNLLTYCIRSMNVVL